MPEHLVQRINDSLAAEQAHRAATMSTASVTPLSSTTRRRRPRMFLGLAGAAAVALIAVVSSNVLDTGQNPTSASHAEVATTSGAADSSGTDRLSGASQPEAAANRAATPSLVQIRLSGTAYTRADFVAQAQTLHVARLQKSATSSSRLDFTNTPSALKECLTAIGAASAGQVRADIASYEGRPAVIIVATTNGRPVAYAVGPRCSRAHAELLHSATPLS